MAGLPQGAQMNAALFTGAETFNFGQQTPTANFSKVLFPTEVLEFFKTQSVVEVITSNQFMGGLVTEGYVADILKEPDVKVHTLTRHQTLESDPLEDEIFQLTVDKANYYRTEIDDFETKMQRADFKAMFLKTATWKLRDKMDREVLKFMSQAAQDGSQTTPGQIGLSNIGGGEDLTHATARERSNVQKIGHGVGDVNPIDMLNELYRKLDEAEAPQEGRWAVVSPRFIELLKKVDSKLMDADFNGGAGNLKNGLVSENVHGFRLYVTNNLPQFTVDEDGTGTAASFDDESDESQDRFLDTGGTKVNGANGAPIRGDAIIAGLNSAVATVQMPGKLEYHRHQDKFVDIVRQKHIYGRNVIRPEAITTAYCIYQAIP